MSTQSGYVRSNALASVRTKLEVFPTPNTFAVEHRLASDPIHLRDESGNLRLHVLTVFCGVSIVRSLNSKLTQSLNNVCLIKIHRFSNGKHGSRIFSVFQRHIQATHLRRHTVSNSGTRNIILRCIDFRPCRQALHRS